MRFFARALFPLTIVLLVAACTNGSDSDDDNSTPPPGQLSTNACSVAGLDTRDSQLRIINGTKCSETNSPIVEVVVQTANEAFLCSGAFITSTHVLTAAHCFLGKQVTATSVISNGASISGTGRVHPQAQIVAGGGQAVFDVAVITLSRAVNVPSFPILVSDAISSGEVISIFGYGVDENGVNQVLRSGQARVLAVDEQHIAAGFSGEGSNSCSGDSGGPALNTIQKDGRTQSGIVGVVSSGSVSCGPGDVALYANVTTSETLNFIQGAAPGVNLL